MARGIEGGKIFRNNSDRDHFLERLEKILKETEASCYSWALIPNHFHLLLRTGPTPITTVMRRLLTGYAQWYNRKYKRQGHVFQNRYKSILCQEDKYFLELVRYIHLNPIRAKIVKDFDSLKKYKYCGHSAVMGKNRNDWQNINSVLSMFGEKLGSARRSYNAFVKKGINEGKRHDLTGGGLLRSAGGWEGVKALRHDKVYQRNDERILGDGDFVNGILSSAEDKLKKEYKLRSLGMNLDSVATRVSDVLDIKIKDVWAKGKYKRIVEARSLLCYWAVRELGMSMSSLAEKLGLSLPSLSDSVKRGQVIAEGKGLSLLKQ
jgi:REP element-mobilizing transposase RayT